MKNTNKKTFEEKMHRAFKAYSEYCNYPITNEETRQARIKLFNRILEAHVEELREIKREMKTNSTDSADLYEYSAISVDKVNDIIDEKIGGEE